MHREKSICRFFLTYGIDPVEFFQFVDIGKGPQHRIEPAQFFDRHVPRIEAADHGPEGIGLVAFQVPEQDIPPVHGMERLKHIYVPAGNGCIGIAEGIEEIRNNGCFYTGHIAGRYEEKVALCRHSTGMQSTYGADALPDIRDAPDILQRIKAHALFFVFGNDDDLIGDMLKRVHEPLDKGLSLVQEKKFLLPVGPAGFPSDKDNGGSHGGPILSASGSFVITDRTAAPASGFRIRISGIMGMGKPVLI
jgi:hypothetical protein